MGNEGLNNYNHHLQQQHHNLSNHSPRPYSNITHLNKNHTESNPLSSPRERFKTHYKEPFTNNHTLDNSTITYNQIKQQSSRINLQRSKSLTAFDPLTHSQVNANWAPKQSRAVQSILRQEGEILSNKNFRIQPYHEEIDNIRTSVRASKEKIVEQMKPMILNEIKEMNLAIQNQKSAGFSNKGKILFLLAQKKHYSSLVLKLEDYDNKIDSIINVLRRQDVTPKTEIQQMNTVKDFIAKLIYNVEKDLPGKSWKVVIQQPDSKIYQMVVMKATKDEVVLKQLSDLLALQSSVISNQEKSLNGSMLFSSTHRLGSPVNNSRSAIQLRNISNVLPFSHSQNNTTLTKSKQENRQEDNGLTMSRKGSENGQQMNQFNHFTNQIQMRQARYPFGQLNKI